MDIVFSYNFLDSKLASLDYSETLSGCQTLQCIENISSIRFFVIKEKSISLELQNHIFQLVTAFSVACEYYLHTFTSNVYIWYL